MAFYETSRLGNNYEQATFPASEKLSVNDFMVCALIHKALRRSDPTVHLAARTGIASDGAGLGSIGHLRALRPAITALPREGEPHKLIPFHRSQDDGPDDALANFANRAYAKYTLCMHRALFGLRPVAGRGLTTSTSVRR